MPKPKTPPPTGEQIQRVRDCWSILLWDKATIARETGLSLQQVVGLIGSAIGQSWTRERVRRQKQHDATLAEQGDECTRRQMRAAVAALGAYAVAAEKAERGIAETGDPEQIELWRKSLPPFRDLHQVERVNTGRPVAGPPASTVCDDRAQSILDRLLAAGAKAEDVTAPFPGETQEGAADPKPEPKP